MFNMCFARSPLHRSVTSFRRDSVRRCFAARYVGWEGVVEC